MHKKEIRLLGIDDSPFNKFKDKNILVIGTIFRGGTSIDGILSTKIKVDGGDSTAKLIRMINRSKFKSQLQCILLDGIAMGGFNIIDIKELNKKTKIPIIVIMRHYPDFKKIKSVIKKLKKDYTLIEKAGKVHKADKIYIQLAGLTLKEAKSILKIACTRSLIPEPIRVAHLIASGIITGESKGQA